MATEPKFTDEQLQAIQNVDVAEIVDPANEMMDLFLARFPNFNGQFTDRYIDNWDFESGKMLVVVTNTGGPGLYRHKIDHVTLVVDIIGASYNEVSEKAREMYGLCLAWPDLQNNVLRVETVKRPFSYPHSETANPTHTFIVDVTFTA